MNSGAVSVEILKDKIKNHAALKPDDESEVCAATAIGRVADRARLVV